MDKRCQTSDWTHPLSPEQIKYAAIDAAISLEFFEQLQAMPDLCRRLTVDDICPKKTVDLVPMNGSDGCMATRAATATILDMLPCKCPSGTVPKTSKQTKRRNRNASMIQAGDGSCVIEIVVIH